MRNELVHVLTRVEDARIMASLITNLNSEQLVVFMNHLELTNQETRERWLELCNKML